MKLRFPTALVAYTKEMEIPKTVSLYIIKLSVLLMLIPILSFMTSFQSLKYMSTLCIPILTLFSSYTFCRFFFCDTNTVKMKKIYKKIVVNYGVQKLMLNTKYTIVGSVHC